MSSNISSHENPPTLPKSLSEPLMTSQSMSKETQNLTQKTSTTGPIGARVGELIPHDEFQLTVTQEKNIRNLSWSSLSETNVQVLNIGTNSTEKKHLTVKSSTSQAQNISSKDKDLELGTSLTHIIHTQTQYRNLHKKNSSSAKDSD